ncbi:hypothetical protein CAP31_02675 [Sulfuriferula sp. AH1]|uniref:hypothetical protein n=1 Tax=Sulfuriferula sp. AH1 TaxID=1985873 RepID=UPI000B3BA5FB|nr:hypothetical protein [Sulfuriferula sp. AH1]ARU30686.1 hypothetical protein CAP31_02675 [Sulfuriferula sp. AH1]
MDKSTKNHLAILRTILTHRKMAVEYDLAKNKRIWDDFQIGMKKNARLVDTEYGVVEFADYLPPTVTSLEEYEEYCENLEAYQRYLMPTFNRFVDLIVHLSKLLIAAAALFLAIAINSFTKLFEAHSIKDNKLEINLPYTLAPRLVQSPAANA